MHIGFSFAVFITHLLEGMFFIGLAGCATTVILSWIFILRDIMSRKDDTANQPEY